MKQASRTKQNREKDMDKPLYTREQIQEAIDYWESQLDENGFEGHEPADYKSIGELIVSGLETDANIAKAFKEVFEAAFESGASLRDMNERVAAMAESFAAGDGCKNALRSLVSRAHSDARKPKPPARDRLQRYDALSRKRRLQLGGMSDES